MKTPSFLGVAAACALAFPVFLACGSDDASTFDDAGTDGGGGGDGPLSCGTKTLCGASCVDTTSDPMNCGSCSGACQSGDLCCGGRCVKSASCGFALTKVTPARGNQNGGDWVKLEGAGFTADMVVLIGDGRAPTLVLDATHAIVQTPPDVVGTYDITLQTPSGTSVNRAAFQYQSASVMPPWSDVNMPTVRGEHPAVTPLQDGRVLIAGGTTVPDHPENALATGILFTRNGATGSVADAASPMSTPRWRCAATTMLDGRALVVGGPADDPAGCVGTTCQSGDVFDPTTNKFTATKGLMTESRTFVWSVLMVDGRVMVTSDSSATVDIYDPKTDSFSSAAMTGKHYLGQRIVRLRDGRVMVLGGDGCDGVNPCGPAQSLVDIYDPTTGKFSAGPPMKQGRSQFTAHVLPDGRVLAIGGASSSAGGVTVPLDSIEAFDPTTSTWTTMTYKLSTGRTWHASALVRDGTVLVMGGYNHDKTCDAVGSVDVVDPIAGTVSPFNALTNANTEWNAVTMLDGSVVGVGGGACGSTMALPDIYFLPGGPMPN